jgi:SAM-dependent methyltransferase
MRALDVATDALGGVVAWYSIIHTPPDRLPVVFSEFHRVLRPGGHLLVAFQVGDERVHRRRTATRYRSTPVGCHPNGSGKG